LFGLFNNKKKKINMQTENTVPFKNSLEANITWLRERLSDCFDVEYRSIKVGKGRQLEGYLVFFNGLVDTTTISESILKPLILVDYEAHGKKPIHEIVYDQLIVVGSVNKEKDLNLFIMKLLSGHVGLLLENEKIGFTIEAIGWKERSVEAPKTETVIKGQHVGFTENVRVNTSIIRSTCWGIS